MIQTYTVTVDYGKTLESMVENGKYTYSNPDINKDTFPITGKGTVETKLELVHLNKEAKASTEEVKAYLEANGLRPATIEELLAFGATYRNLQREFPIIALGSYCASLSSDKGYVPCLFKSVEENDNRSLSLLLYAGPWFSYCRFLAVRK